MNVLLNLKEQHMTIRNTHIGQAGVEKEDPGTPPLQPTYPHTQYINILTNQVNEARWAWACDVL